MKYHVVSECEEVSTIKTPGDGIWSDTYRAFWLEYGVVAPVDMSTDQEVDDYIRGYHEAKWPQPGDVVQVDHLEACGWFDEPPAYQRGYRDGFENRHKDGSWYPTY